MLFLHWLVVVGDMRVSGGKLAARLSFALLAFFEVGNVAVEHATGLVGDGSYFTVEVFGDVFQLVRCHQVVDCLIQRTTGDIAEIDALLAVLATVALSNIGGHTFRLSNPFFATLPTRSIPFPPRRLIASLPHRLVALSPRCLFTLLPHCLVVRIASRTANRSRRTSGCRQCCT